MTGSRTSATHTVHEAVHKIHKTRSTTRKPRTESMAESRGYVHRRKSTPVRSAVW